MTVSTSVDTHIEFNGHRPVFCVGCADTSAVAPDRVSEADLDMVASFVGAGLELMLNRLDVDNPAMVPLSPAEEQRKIHQRLDSGQAMLDRWRDNSLT